ncbi:hypothetical protein BG004_003494 [Podila humilis]|nr:hypothetical protein BG004_003494 [Podila humilis]
MPSPAASITAASFPSSSSSLSPSDFEPRKFVPMSLQPQADPQLVSQSSNGTTLPPSLSTSSVSSAVSSQQQNSPGPQQHLPSTSPSTDQLQQLSSSFKTEPLPILPPRVLEYSPHYGPEGQTFTMTLQSNTDKTLRIGFGTLVVDTKQYSANGYVTLSCTVPAFAITKWFVSKVPLYVLQMENDMVMESWPFGDYNYYDNMGFAGETNNSNNNSVNLSIAPPPPPPQQSSNKRAYAGPQDLGGTSGGSPLLDTKRPHLDLDLSETNQLADDDYSNITSSSGYDSGLYPQSLQPSSPYGSRAPPSLSTSASYARPGYYSADQMIAPHLPTYTAPELATSAYSMSSGPSSNSNTVNGGNNNSNNNPTTGNSSGNSYHHHPQPVAPSAYMPQPHPSTSMGAGGSMSLTSYPYSGLLNKASLKFNGNMDDMAINWSSEEWESHRRLVQFWRRQEKNEIHCSFHPVVPAERQPNSIVISCIYWAEKNDCFLTSVDCIYLLESLIAVRFTVEEKNRIRRNLEGFRPITVSKCKPESAEFFKLIMSFPNPKPRNIEKDVKVFPWKVLPYALKKIISKYTASYSSTASIQTDAFHNANFPNGSTLPVTQHQQAILDSSVIPGA